VSVRHLPLGDFGENVVLALDTLRANKVRSSLTILGVVIGVSTVMAMAAIIQGIREQIVRTIEIAGPTTFYVMKVFSQTPLNPDALPRWVRIRPDVAEREARRIAMLPEIRYASLWSQVLGRIEYRGARTQQMTIYGADDGYPEIIGGGVVRGRSFTRAELAGGEAVVMLEVEAARRLFGDAPALGALVRVHVLLCWVLGVLGNEC
jgi:putative ABC transport system permease protein